MSVQTQAPSHSAIGVAGLFRPWKMVQRNMLVYRHTFMVIFSGFFEPLFYLLAIGFGVGSIIGEVSTGGREIAYPAFVAPAMLAMSCLNGALTDGFFNPFFRLHFQKTYDAVLATPMGIKDIAIGEVIWAQIRGSLYSLGFLVVMVVMNLIEWANAVASFPAAILVSATFSAAALMLMTFTRAITDFDKAMNLVIHPMFLFSTTFFPLSIYPAPLQWAVQLTPLYHGVTLLRGVGLGTFGGAQWVSLAYLVLLLVVSMKIAGRRLQKLLIK